MNLSYEIPVGGLAVDDGEEAAKRRRRELREKLLRGESVIVKPTGEVADKSKQEPDEPAIKIPEGKLATYQEITIPEGQFSDQDSEEAAKRRRKELREKLLRGESVVVKPSGEVAEKRNQDSEETAITIPEGKLAIDFYWYERDPELYGAELDAMRKYFPQFQLEKLADGRLSWHGALEPKLRSRGKWYLQVVYDNNHPNNNTYGGSVKVYSIEPDLKEFVRQLGSIPHLLRDSRGEPYLCTSRREDFKASAEHSTTAASALAWAAKWIAAFELWLAGDISTSEFSGHNI
jgi:hypothetical protein